jgi:hypothetical protein
MNLATALLAEIKERGLDELFSTEEAISRQTTAMILETLRSNKAENKPTPADKLRLVLVYYMSSADGTISKDDIVELETELKNAGADIKPFEYLEEQERLCECLFPLRLRPTKLAHKESFSAALAFWEAGCAFFIEII